MTSNNNELIYDLAISFAQVPVELIGILLPTEIVSEKGASYKVVLNVNETKATTVKVISSGTYLVRAELPGGRQVGVEVDVGETTEAVVMTNAAVLDLRADDFWVVPSKSLWRCVRNTHHSSINIVFEDAGASFIDLDNEREKQAESPSQGGRHVLHDLVALWEFDSWRETTNKGDLETRVMIVRPFGEEPISSVEDGILEVASVSNLHNGKYVPLLALVQAPESSGPHRTLVVVPPGDGTSTLSLVERSADSGEVSPWFQACWDSGDRKVDAIVSFMRTGAIEAARQASHELMLQTNGYVDAYLENPVRACLVAYTFLKVLNIERLSWTRELADGFPSLPDGAIIHGWRLIRVGEAGMAHTYFKKALDRGIPMFSEGIALLRSGIAFLSGLASDNADLKYGLAISHRLVTSANLESQLTCLNIDKKFILRERKSFEEERKWIEARDQILAGHPEVSSRTKHLLQFVEGRTNWALKKRVIHYHQALNQFEQSLSLSLGPGVSGITSGEDNTPSCIICTSVGTGITQWKLGPALVNSPSCMVRSITNHEENMKDAIQLKDGGIIVVDGAKLRLGDEAAFVVSAGKKFDPKTDEVFVVRGAVRPEGLEPEELAELGLIVDAWRSKVAEHGPPDELAEFICLFVVASMTRDFYTFDRDKIEDDRIRDEWNFIPRRLAMWRDKLLNRFTIPGSAVFP